MEASSVAAGQVPVGGLPLRFGLFGDERLARLVGSGSERAFATIYERYHQPLYRYCRSIVRHDADAQDVLQSTIASAFAALKHGRRDAPLRPWLFRIAHNEAISLIRRRRNDRELTDAPEEAIGSVEDQVGERARLALLVADLQELPARQRGALVMRELNGLSHEEIAVALKTSVGTAKQAIFEARRALMEFAEGRSMVCEEVRRTVSDGDARVLRGRRVRAHLRDCSGCAAFAAAIATRRDDMRALMPVLAPGASSAILARIFGAGSGPTAGGGAGAGVVAGGAAGKTVAAALATKALAGAAVVLTAAGTVAGGRALFTGQHQSLPAPAGAHATGMPGTAEAVRSAATAARRASANVAVSDAFSRELGGRAANSGSSAVTAAGRRSRLMGQPVQRVGSARRGTVSPPAAGTYTHDSSVRLGTTRNPVGAQPSPLTAPLHRATASSPALPEGQSPTGDVTRLWHQTVSSRANALR